jgi:hypothetical protein
LGEYSCFGETRSNIAGHVVCTTVHCKRDTTRRLISNFTCLGTTICLSQGMSMKRDPRKESEDHFGIQVMRGADPFGIGPEKGSFSLNMEHSPVIRNYLLEVC